MRLAEGLLLVVPVLAIGCVGPGEPELRVAEDVAARRARFVPQSLTADITYLSDGDREALGHLVEAARAVDEIFLRQAWAGNQELARRVAALEGPNAAPARDYYRIMYGPWDRLDELAPFLGDRPHPPGAGFYPEGMGPRELEDWLVAHPGDQEAFQSLYTVIRREGDRLVAVPYSKEYRGELERAASALRSAAAATTSSSLGRFLELRAAALLDDDYFASDVAWMDIDSPIEVVIGPYETYEDRLFGYKAAFEAFVCVANPEESNRLAVFKAELPHLERNLPIPDEHKNLDRGAESPIRVVDELYTAGDTRAGIQTIAFNLPNDERVRQAKGSKKVMLKNMMRAKYDAILRPIAERVLPVGEAGRIDFETFFQEVLQHELAHGLGPGNIVVDGRATEVRLELRDMYSPLEEAKADVLGVYDIYALVERGVIDPAILEPLPWTYLAGMFRTTRFGLAEAHGRSMVIQANFLLASGAIEITEDGRFRPVPERFRDAFRELAHELLMIQALGDADAARRMEERYGAVPEAMLGAIGRLADLPVDVDPVYALDGLS